MPYSILYCYIGWVIHLKYHDIVGSEPKVKPKDATCKIINDCKKNLLRSLRRKIFSVFGPQRQRPF